jgi:Protein of unknown function (DUF3617)
MKQTARSLVLVTGIAVALSASSLSAAERLRPGQWEFTMTRVGEAANTFKHCINAVEAGSVNGDTASSRAYAEKAAAAAGTGCKITDYRVAGDSVSYAMKCGTTSIRSTASYHGDTYEGDMFTKRDGGAEVAAHVKAKRLGNDCP